MKKSLKNLDFILLKLPFFYSPHLLNGIGYVHNILKKCGIKHITYDLNAYYYYFMNNYRNLLSNDTGEYKNMVLWEFLDYFIKDLVDIKPKIIGISIDAGVYFNSEVIVNFIGKIKKILPDTIFIAGGYACFSDNIPALVRRVFDYTIVRESENSLPFLINEIMNNKLVKDLPGVISKYDSFGRKWQYAPIYKNLDAIDFPRYEWANLKMYELSQNLQMAPIVPNRGCLWGRCYFCSETVQFRTRSAQSLADEVEFLNKNGFNNFLFSCNDFNGDPQVTIDFCNEIIKRKLKVNFQGQLRIDERNNLNTFKLFEKAGILFITFGVDGFSNRALKLLNKGYDMKVVEKNLKDCAKTKVKGLVNLLTGIPGEVEEDVEEYIENITHLHKYIKEINCSFYLYLQNGSDYFINSEKHKIEFHKYKRTIDNNYKFDIPNDLWCCREPFLDIEISKKRLKRILSKIRELKIYESDHNIEITKIIDSN